MTWLDDHRYRWIRDHLLQQPTDQLDYTPCACGRDEDAPRRSLEEVLRAAVDALHAQEASHE